jgi:hypothetical protein
VAFKSIVHMPPLRNLAIIRKSLPLFAILVGGLLSSNIGVENNIIANAQTPTPSSPNSSLPTIQITSVQDGQQVPPGELTIQGISSDDEETDCNVYADINDITPMRNVTAAGDSRGEDDFSQWTFTYRQDYQLITLGANELTAKISCINDGEFDLNPFPTAAASATSSSSPLSEWDTVNVTGVAGAASIPLPLPTAGSTEGLVEEDEESNEEDNEGDEEDSDGSDEDSEDNNFGNGNNDNEEDGNNGDGGDGDGDNFFGGDSFFD